MYRRLIRISEDWKLITKIIMKRILTSVIVCLMAIAAMAQNKADIEVIYTAMSPNFKNGILL